MSMSGTGTPCSVWKRVERSLFSIGCTLPNENVLQVHPRHDLTRPLRGVFSTRSPQRPNPVSIETVEIAGIEGTVIDVVGIDAVDGTPLLDIKCIA